VRRALRADATQILELVSQYAAQGLMLPRTPEEIAARIDSYVVATEEAKLGIERLARARDIEELFALSLTDNFFLSLSYELTTISRYPEKLARYETLTKSGVEIIPKRCFQKVLGRSWPAPQLVGQVVTVRQRAG